MSLAIAWRNLLDRKPRTLAAVAGVTMAVLLMYLQMGFVAIAQDTATLYLDRLDFDLFLTSPHYVHFAQSYTFSRSRLYVARQVRGVLDASPIYSSYGTMRLVGDPISYRVQVLGVIPSDPVFLDRQLVSLQDKVRGTDDAVIDSMGRVNVDPIPDGGTVQVNDRRLTLRGRYKVGGTFTGDSCVVVSAETFANLQGGFDLDQVDFGLVRLKPGADARRVAGELSSRLGPDVRVVTRRQIIDAEQKYWVNVKPVGIMFRYGAIVAFILGGVVLYQVMTAEASNRRREFATLKAIGFSNASLVGVIGSQATLMALAAFTAGTVLALVAYPLIGVVAKVDVSMTAGRAALVLVLTLVLALAAGTGAVRRVRKTDPAELF